MWTVERILEEKCLSLGGIAAVEKAENPFRALEDPAVHPVCAVLEKLSFHPLLLLFAEPVALRPPHGSFGWGAARRALPERGLFLLSAAAEQLVVAGQALPHDVPAPAAGAVKLGRPRCRGPGAVGGGAAGTAPGADKAASAPSGACPERSGRSSVPCWPPPWEPEGRRGCCW